MANSRYNPNDREKLAERRDRQEEALEKINTHFGAALGLNVATVLFALMNLFMYIYPASTVVQAKNFLKHPTDLDPSKLVIADMVISPWPCIVSLGMSTLVIKSRRAFPFVTGVHVLSSAVLAVLGSLSIVAYHQNGVDGLIGRKTNTTLQPRRHHHHSSNSTYIAANDDSARVDTERLWITCAVVIFINAFLLACASGIYARMHVICYKMRKAERESQRWIGQ